LNVAPVHAVGPPWAFTRSGGAASAAARDRAMAYEKHPTFSSRPTRAALARLAYAARRGLVAQLTDVATIAMRTTPIKKEKWRMTKVEDQRRRGFEKNGGEDNHKIETQEFWQDALHRVREHRPLGEDFWTSARQRLRLQTQPITKFVTNEKDTTNQMGATCNQGTNEKGTSMKGAANEKCTNDKGTNDKGAYGKDTNEKGTNEKGINEEGANVKGANEKGTNVKGATINKTMRPEVPEFTSKLLRATAANNVAKTESPSCSLQDGCRCICGTMVFPKMPVRFAPQAHDERHARNIVPAPAVNGATIEKGTANSKGTYEKGATNAKGTTNVKSATNMQTATNAKDTTQTKFLGQVFAQSEIADHTISFLKAPPLDTQRDPMIEAGPTVNIRSPEQRLQLLAPSTRKLGQPAPHAEPAPHNMKGTTDAKDSTEKGTTNEKVTPHEKGVTSEKGSSPAHDVRPPQGSAPSHVARSVGHAPPAPQAVQKDGGEIIMLKVKVSGSAWTPDQKDSVVKYTIKKYTPLHELMNTYLSHVGLQAGQVRFMVNDKRITPDDTGEKLGLVSGDCIMAY